MSLTVFETRGIPATLRERIVAAIEAGGKCVLAPFEAWVTSDGRGKVQVVITGLQGFDRQVLFSVDDAEGEITERVRRTLDG
jgi:hypothetical protein